MAPPCSPQTLFNKMKWVLDQVMRLKINKATRENITVILPDNQTMSVTLRHYVSVNMMMDPSTIEFTGTLRNGQFTKTYDWTYNEKQEYWPFYQVCKEISALLKR